MNPCLCRNRCTIVTAMIACLLFAGIPAAMAADGTNATSPAGGTIIVMSFPQGASVFLNGEYRGITPIKLENIPPGKYVVSISKAGSNNDSVPVEIFEGSTREIGFTLEAASPSPAVSGGSGSVAIDSSPGGASVMLDGKPAGTTPAGRAALIVNDVPAGSHTITVELAGYPAYTSTVTVIKNQVVKVDAVLETQSPAIAGTTVAATSSQKPVPLPSFVAVAAAGLAGLIVVLRRSRV